MKWPNKTVSRASKHGHTKCCERLSKIGLKPAHMHTHVPLCYTQAVDSKFIVSIDGVIIDTMTGWLINRTKWISTRRTYLYGLKSSLYRIPTLSLNSLFDNDDGRVDNDSNRDGITVFRFNCRTWEYRASDKATREMQLHLQTCLCRKGCVHIKTSNFYINIYER